jgi:maltose alpha-D-glucosyltransferase / alpha-amylase
MNHFRKFISEAHRRGIRVIAELVINHTSGEPARSLGERKLKYSCFRDVAGMVRSFHYAAYGSVFMNHIFSDEDRKKLSSLIEQWYSYAAGVFLESYFNKVEEASIIPESNDDRERMLNIYLLEKAVYELGYEVNLRCERLIQINA